jgi:hypothetical protein
MNFKEVFKRVFPFFATFAVGLFIASFFVSVALPKFERRNWKKHREYKRMKFENEQLRKDNCRMRRELAEKERLNSELDVPPPIPPTIPMKTVPYKER